MEEILSEQMKELSLETDKILGKYLAVELKFCESVKDLFFKRTFDQRIVFGYINSKIYVTLFFMSEKRLGESDANDILSIVKECFEQKNKILRDLGWCANFKIDIERINIDNLKFRTTLTFINNFVARWVSSVSSEETLYRCDSCSEETLYRCDSCTWKDGQASRKISKRKRVV